MMILLPRRVRPYVDKSKLEQFPRSILWKSALDLLNSYSDEIGCTSVTFSSRVDNQQGNRMILESCCEVATTVTYVCIILSLVLVDVVWCNI